MDQGVELVDGDWNDTAAIERALDGVDGAFVMLPAVWAPSPDFREAKGVIANYVEALTKAAPPRVVALSSMGANRTSGAGAVPPLNIHNSSWRWGSSARPAAKSAPEIEYHSKFRGGGRSAQFFFEARVRACLSCSTQVRGQ